MSAERSTLELLARSLAAAVEPLRQWVADLDHFRTLMFRLGWEVDSLPPPFADAVEIIHKPYDLAQVVRIVRALATHEPTRAEIAP